MFKKSLGDDPDTLIRERRLDSVKTLGQRVGVAAACRSLNVSRATYYRRQKPPAESAPRPKPSRALSETERREVAWFFSASGEPADASQLTTLPAFCCGPTAVDRGLFVAATVTVVESVL